MADPVTPLAPAAPGAPVNPPPVVVTDSQKIDNLNAQIALMLAVPDARRLAREAAAELYRTLQPSQAVAQAAAPVQLLPPMPPVEQQPPPLELPCPHSRPNLTRLWRPSIHLQPACITAVITHDLKASDLYKLDTRVKDSEPTYSLSASGTLEMNNSRLYDKAYKNLNSVTFPLHNYFAILAVHLPHHSAGSVYFYGTSRTSRHSPRSTNGRQCSNITHCSSIGDGGDMAAGQYEQWGAPDLALLSTYVFPHRKAINVASSSKASSKRPQSSSSEPCRNYNLGKCNSPCNFGRGPGQTSSFCASSSLSRLGRPEDVPVTGPLATASFPPLPHACLFPEQPLPPLRPNTDTRVNTAPVDAPPLPTVPSILNEDAWAF
ncbi:hypothetical protein C8J57DRAFT_1502433 [Mycena rebaudengoi]|nr:hypothetical protein C8J57DRAFT_1502433 [Mycena rebaudengoi]